MNADQIRAAFIKRQLARALRGRDRGQMMRTAQEFRRYVHWCSKFIPPPEQKTIWRMLVRLERLATG